MDGGVISPCIAEHGLDLLTGQRQGARQQAQVRIHDCAEAAIGGPFAAVQSGDRIRLSILNKRIDLLVDKEEITRRLAAFKPPPGSQRGYQALYQRSVLQAPQGCDFDFLVGSPK